MSIGGNREGDPRPHILIVEDNYLTASALCDIVRDCGFAVAGPVARLDRGLDLVGRRDIHGALVDINLAGTESFPLCSELGRRKVPFAFVTAYQPTAIPAKFRSAPVLGKPIDPGQIRITLGSFGSDAAVVEPALSAGETGNRLLDSLPPEEREALQPLLERIALNTGELVERAGTAPWHVLFPSSGVVSLTAWGDRAIEVAQVGPEGLVGMAAVLQAEHSSFDAVVRHPGHAWRVPARLLALQLAERPRLQGRLLAHAHGFMAELGQGLAAAAQATIEERLARWLLIAADRLGSPELTVTHDKMAEALSVRRAGVTVALHLLEGKGAIRSNRQRVQILDREELIAVAEPYYKSAELAATLPAAKNFGT
jgi:CRP-like cAMP-binding protein